MQEVWRFCHTVRDDGVGHGDCLAQLTHLLFLKLAHEDAQPPCQRNTRIPALVEAMVACADGDDRRPGLRLLRLLLD